MKCFVKLYLKLLGFLTAAVSLLGATVVITQLVANAVGLGKFAPMIWGITFLLTFVGIIAYEECRGK